MDPPYWGTEGYGVDFPALAVAMRSIKGKAVVSVNDTPEMREIFAGLSVRRLAIRYTVGGRQGRAEHSELVLKNWSNG